MDIRTIMDRIGMEHAGGQSATQLAARYRMPLDTVRRLIVAYRDERLGPVSDVEFIAPRIRRDGRHPGGRMLMGGSRDWIRRAACGGMDADVFYPVASGPDAFGEAERVCRDCPVRAMCLEYALDNDEQYGMWGGMDPEERRRLKRLDMRRRRMRAYRRGNGVI